MATLLLREDDISKNTPIGGNVETSRLIPAIKSAQITAIKPLLGEAFYANLVEKYKTDTLTEEYETLYEDYIKPMLIHLSTAYYFSYGAYNIGNSGIYKATGSDAESISKDEVDYLVKAQEKTYESYKSGYFEFMKVNAKLFPLYSEEETRSTKRRSYGGWSFGNTGGGNGTAKAMGITNAQYLAILERLDLLDLEVDERVFTVSGVNVDNTDPFNPIIEGISWGDIQGSLLDQTDLVSVLNDKVDKATGERLINSSEITKLGNIEDNADITDTENVRSSGALMDDEVANLQEIKDFDSSDYANAVETTNALATKASIDQPIFNGEVGIIGDLHFKNKGDKIFGGISRSNFIEMYDSLTGGINLRTLNGTSRVNIEGGLNITGQLSTDASIKLDSGEAFEGANNTSFLPYDSANGNMVLTPSTLGSYGKIRFNYGPDSLEGFRLTHLGDVGIGTTSPDEKLDVNGTILGTEIKDSGDNILSEKIDSKTINEPNGSDVVANIVSLTQAEYDAATPTLTTFYIITD